MRELEGELEEDTVALPVGRGGEGVPVPQADPENEGEQRMTFSAVEGFKPPSAVELAGAGEGEADSCAFTGPGGGACVSASVRSAANSTRGSSR